MWKIRGMKAMKKKNKHSALRMVFTFCLAVLLALSALAVIVNKMQGKTVFAFGYTCLWVQTGSMEPTIPAKSYILVKKADAADCAVGDVIVFVCRDADSPVYGSLITHRIDEVTPEGFCTKGDSVLSVRDPWVVEPDDVVAVYVRNLTVLTFFGRIFSSWFGLYLIIGILILSCAFLYIPDIVRGIREVEAEERDAEIARRVEQEVQRLQTRKKSKDIFSERPPEGESEKDRKDE